MVSTYQQSFDNNAGIYVVEFPSVPVLKEPLQSSGVSGWLRKGDLVRAFGPRLTEAEHDLADWLQVAPESSTTVIDKHSFRRATLSNSTDSSCSDEIVDAAIVSEDVGGDENLTTMHGYVRWKCPFLGCLVRRTADLPASEQRLSQAERQAFLKSYGVVDAQLPDEAEIWNQDQLQHYILTSESPKWSTEPPCNSTGLLKSVSRLDDENRLRTSVLWLAHADAVVVAAGDDWSVDDGSVASCRRRQSFVPPFAYTLFREDPKSAWDQWSRLLERSESVEPHTGFSVVIDWIRRAPFGGFAMTDSVDGLLASSGWPEECLAEMNGAVNSLQCSHPCSAQTWGTSFTSLVVNEVPVCPNCSAVARPSVSMGRRDAAFKSVSAVTQCRLEQWLTRVARLPADEEGPSIGGPDCSRPSVVFLDLGCQPGSEPRRILEDAAEKAGERGRIIRIGRQHFGISAKFEGRAVSLGLPAATAVRKMKALENYMDTARFIVEDRNGSGDLIIASRTASVGYIFLRAVVSTGRSLDEISEETLSLKVQNVLTEERGEISMGNRRHEAVPANLFSQIKPAGSRTVRICVGGWEFGSRGSALRHHLEEVDKLATDLVHAFHGPAYQSKLSACTDREMVTNLVREVHSEVLPSHGYAFSETSSGSEIVALLSQMQAFLMSGKCDPKVAQMLDWTMHLSGYVKMSSLPHLSRPKGGDQGPANAPKSTTLVVAGPTSASHRGGDTTHRWAGGHRPPDSVWIAGTWCGFEPKQMHWNGCEFSAKAVMSSKRRESFQLLLGGSWDATMYPDVKDANPWTEHKIMGPDTRGHGRNWEIGRRVEDSANTGDTFMISVEVNGQGRPCCVRWRNTDTCQKRPSASQPVHDLKSLTGTWRYGSKQYCISSRGDSVRFTGPHAIHGHVTGILALKNNFWAYSELRPRTSGSDSGCAPIGDIRICWGKEGNLISNYRGAQRNEWGRGIIAVKV